MTPSTNTHTHPPTIAIDIQIQLIIIYIHCLFYIYSLNGVKYTQLTNKYKYIICGKILLYNTVGSYYSLALFSMKNNNTNDNIM